MNDHHKTTTDALIFIIAHEKGRGNCNQYKVNVLQFYYVKLSMKLSDVTRTSTINKKNGMHNTLSHFNWIPKASPKK